MSVVSGALLLGATAAAPDLFLSSSATDSLARAIGGSTRYGAGLTIALHDARYDNLAGSGARVSTAAVRDRVLRRAAAPLSHLGRRVLTILADAVPVSSRRASSAEANPVRLVYRTGALDHLDVVDGDPLAGAPGVWIQDVTAYSLDVEPGDEIFLDGRSGEPIPLRVAGVYAALANAPPDPFWEPLANHFRPPPATNAPIPPPFVLVDRETADEMADRLGQRQADFQWEFPIAAGATLDLESASELEHDFDALTGAVQNTRSPIGRYFRCTTCSVPPPPIRLDIRSTLEQNVQQAQETADSLRPSIQLLSAAGLLTALVVLGAAGLYSVNRRRTEMRLLAARGVAPATLASKAALETVLPVVAGVAAGWAASVAALGRLGPGDRIEGDALWDAARAAGATVPAALLVIALVAGLSTLRFSPRASSRRGRGWLAWEIPVLVAAGLALRQALAGDGVIPGDGGEVGSVSAWLLIFPVLFVGAGGGLTARAFRRLLRASHAPRLRIRASLYLAVNRLAAARSLAVMLVTASALAFGVFLYSQTMAASVRATTIAKSYVFTGSDVAVSVDRQYTAPESFDWAHTTVASKLDAGRLQPSNIAVDMLAIDPETFEQAAYWDDSFADQPLSSLMESLRRPSTGALRVVVAGDVPSGAGFDVGGVSVPFDVVARVDAFPGQFLDRPLFVVDRDAASDAFSAAGTRDPIATGAPGSLWVRGPTNAILETLPELGLGPDDALTADAVLENPSFVAISRTFTFLEALGALASLLVLVGILLYVQTRQRSRIVSYALARRMGLRARSHYAALVAELAGMLGVSFVFGSLLGAAAARFVYARVDLLPSVPPQPLLRIPSGSVLPVVAGLAAAAVVGALLAHRSAERGDVAEALRSGA